MQENIGEGGRLPVNHDFTHKPHKVGWLYYTAVAPLSHAPRAQPRQVVFFLGPRQLWPLHLRFHHSQLALGTPTEA